MNGQTVVFEVCVQMGLGLGGFDNGVSGTSGGKE